MNNSIKLTLTLLKRSGKETSLFITILTLVSALILNFTNLTLIANEISTNSIETMLTSTLLIIILSVSFFVLYHANNYLIRIKSNELAIQVLSGASPYKLGFLLTIQTAILNCIGYCLGTILGIFISPILNIFIFGYFKFSISLNSLIYCFLFACLQTIILGLINQGFGYRNDIKALLGINEKKQFVSKRYEKTLKLKHYMCFVLMFSIFIIFFIPPDILKDLKELSSYIFMIPILGSLLFYNTFLPLYIDKIKKRKYLNHKTNIIVLSNFKTSLEKNKIVFLALLSISTSFPIIPILLEGSSLIFKFITLSFLVCILLVTFMIIFYGLSFLIDEIKALKTLIVLGYSKKDLLKIIKDKIFLLYGTLLVLPLFITSVYIAFLVLNLGFNLGLSLIFLGSYIGLFLISTSIIYVYGISLLNQNS
ncbi:hypothetical protein HMPREF1092_02633 [Clostridium thermobutyricum]|uniref:ABC3 transporter permease C-terminal domain-containing protein n=1 Tax=Clostridium thermobutyricum TaxID=29372 RepID=N9WBS5_9CLOT|nr:FtsX-like permease family protein [Clostridium thermobutyricum]ENZ00466.1 hypothetical protein HMPREF1092_02633 [Clostridium thermobutyricum]